MASLRQHSLHIWSAGQPARILSPGYCPAGLGTGSSTRAHRNEGTAFLPQHSTSRQFQESRGFPTGSLGGAAQSEEILSRILLLLQGSSVSRMTHCGDHREGHSVSWDTPASDVQCVPRDAWKRVKDSGIFPRSYKSLVVNANTCHE